MPRKPAKQVVTVQATGKFWKALQALGLLGLMGCVTWGLVVNHGRAPNEPVDFVASTLSVIGAILSVFVLMFGRVGAWWFHR